MKKLKYYTEFAGAMLLEFRNVATTLPRLCVWLWKPSTVRAVVQDEGREAELMQVSMT